jgi:hypothetical protein
MSFILFVLSWFLPYALFRKDKQRLEQLINAYTESLGNEEKNTPVRKRQMEAKRLAAIKSAVVMGMIELPFLFFLDEFTRDGLIGALGVATGAVLVAVIVMPKFEDSSYWALDKAETTRALAAGEVPNTEEFIRLRKRFLKPAPKLHVSDQHGSATVQSAEQSDLIDHDAMAPVEKGGR